MRGDAGILELDSLRESVADLKRCHDNQLKSVVNVVSGVKFAVDEVY